VNRVPVANQGKDEQQESDQQQAEGLRSVNSGLRMLAGVVLIFRFYHANIVPRGETARATLSSVQAARCYTTHHRPLLSLMPAFAGNNSGRIARFGVFELDLAAGELRRNGAKLRLQDQPFQVLTLLLERAGEVVTREEMRQKLWPADTFVDFDHSLNTAVNKLRETLGDSASRPRYIETLARRGYRFIAPVQNNVENDKAGTAAPRCPPSEVRQRSLQDSTPTLHPDLEVPIPRRSLTRGLFALVQLMYLIFYVVALLRLRAVQGFGESSLPEWGATTVVGAVMVTAGVGIPLRCYLLSAVGFDYQRLGEKFQQLFPFILALDQLWAFSPFLLIHKIGPGAAFAASAALLYVPFSERTLIRMAYLRRESRERDGS
jgi:cholera toxin transcriptional activator